MAHFLTGTISPFPHTLPHTYTHYLSLFLCLSTVLLSSPLFRFNKKMLSDDFMLSLNKQSPLRIVLISKVTSIQNYHLLPEGSEFSWLHP